MHGIDHVLGCHGVTVRGGHHGWDASCDQSLTFPRDCSARGEGLQAATVPAAAAWAIGEDGHMADLTCAAAHAVVEASIQNQPAADACAHGDIDHVACVAACSVQVFADGSCVGVVLEASACTEPLLQDLAQRHVVPARQVGGLDQQTLWDIEWSRRTDADAVDILVYNASLIEHPFCARNDALDHGLRPLVGKGGPNLAASHRAILVDQAGTDLGPTKVNAQDRPARHGACPSSFKSA